MLIFIPMFSFKEIPFVKLLFPLIAGIITAAFLVEISWRYLLPVLFPWMALLIFTHLKWGKVYRMRMLSGAVIFSGFFVLGLMLTGYHRPQPNPGQSVYIVSGGWKNTGSYYKAEALAASGKTRFNRAKVLIYLRKDSSTTLPPIGARLVTSKKSVPVSKPFNPYEFDYAKYLEKKGITAAVYLNNQDFFVAGNSGAFKIHRSFNTLKQKLMRIIYSQPVSPETKALLEALLLGEKANLDPDIKRAYTAAGAMHVLAVSGLHVGIVLLFINFFFKIFELKNRGKTYHLLKSVITLLAIWMFAGITGFAPSITRATTMFSFLIVGKALNRNTNIYNSLAIAAFFLLFINPYSLFSVGFQLSFLAVFGIVFFHPKIYPLLYFNNPIFRKIWELTSVSLAAQLTTFPIALLYFHQFPVYFLLSNLVVIPFAFIIVISGLVLFIISPFQSMASLLAVAIDHAVLWMNTLVLSVEKLPFHKIGGVAISHAQTLYIYLLIASLTAFLIIKKVRFLYFSMFALLLLLSIGLYHKTQSINRINLNFYRIYNHTAIDFVQQNKHLFAADSSLLNNPDKISWHCANHWNVMGLSDPVNTAKATLNNPAVYAGMQLILTQNHILYHQTLICINHSSHKAGALKPFAYNILLLGFIGKNPDSIDPGFDIIVLNYKNIDHPNRAPARLIVERAGGIKYNLLKRGYLSLNP